MANENKKPTSRNQRYIADNLEGSPRPGPARGAPEADAASAGPDSEKGQQREKNIRRRLKNPNAHQD